MELSVQPLILCWSQTYSNMLSGHWLPALNDWPGICPCVSFQAGKVGVWSRLASVSSVRVTALLDWTACPFMLSKLHKHTGNKYAWMLLWISNAYTIITSACTGQKKVYHSISSCIHEKTLFITELYGSCSMPCLRNILQRTTPRLPIEDVF